MKVVRGVLLVLVCLPLVAIVYAAIKGQSHSSFPAGRCKGDRKALRLLRPGTTGYLHAAGEPVGEVRLTGARIVPMDVREGEIDKRIYCALPDRLRARSPREVGAVALVRYRSRAVGIYTGGGKALVILAHLTIVDRRSHVQYSPRREFLGSDPPDMVETLGEGPVTEFGDPPTKGIVKYLEGLAEPSGHG